MDRSAWLAGLKVGDEVAIERNHRTPRICKVQRVTAHRITADNTEFRRKYGDQVTRDVYSRAELQPIIDRHRLEAEYATLRAWLQQVADTFNRETGAPTLKQLRAMHSSFLEAK